MSAGEGAFNLSAIALRHRALAWFFIVAIAACGVWAYCGLGRAEDPSFTIKQMVVVLDWPGASASQMTESVVDPVERKLQELPFLDHTDSYARPGEATITISLKDSTPPREVAGLWYQVRKKVGDMRALLPSGVQDPYFNDEFGDVFGIVYALTGDGFSLPELKHVGEDIRERLLDVSGVGKVQLIGTQDERIELGFSWHRLARLGLTLRDLADAVQKENAVTGGAFVDTPSDRVFLRTGLGATSPEWVANLPVQAHGRLVPLGDIVSMDRVVADPPAAEMRVDGKPAIGIAISMDDGGNIIDLGGAVAARMAEIERSLPLGIHLERVNDQPKVVTESVGEFEESFLEALAIVLLVSFVSLGWRTGLVVAISVPLVLAGVMVGMKLAGIDLQRISLGAMIIALGLLVDDAIIAVETMLVKLEQGWDRTRAGSFAYTSTAFPMLAGTLVTAAGYLPVGLARSSTGEYTNAIFWVVGLSLILSWFVAVLFVPVLGAGLLRAPKTVHAPDVIYSTRPYRAFRRVVRWCVDRRWTVLGVAGGMFALSLAGFALVPQQFFPSSARLEVVVDMQLPEGSSFAATREAAIRLERVLASAPGIRNSVAYIGEGSPRFFLASSPVLQRANFTQFVINTTDVPAREALLARLDALAQAGPSGGFDGVRMRVSRLELGPPVGYPVQFRVLGPDPDTLRRIASDVGRLMRADPHLSHVNNDWGNPGKEVEVELDQSKARRLGIAGSDIAQVLQAVTQGVAITQYREGTDLIPVMLRATASERGDLASIGDVAIPTATSGTVPLAQVATIRYRLEEPIIWRRARTPVMTVRGDIGDGAQAPDVTAQLLPAIARLRASLPSGYRIEAGGAAEESAKGQASVNAVMPLMVIVMITLLMLQLQNIGRVAMVLLTAPLGLIGVTAALLITGRPFGFVAMLGVIALAGIIMRNSVILVDQIDSDVRDGLAPADAIVEATVRRARPILLTAAAAILALIPLGMSTFWGPMAIAIMGGLLVATVLTLCVLPALYAAWEFVPRSTTTAATVSTRFFFEKKQKTVVSWRYWLTPRP